MFLFRFEKDDKLCGVSWLAGWVFFLGLLFWLSLKYCWKMLLVILQLSSMVKVILKCLNSWKGCSWGDWQRIANFLGIGGDSWFGKQEAALHYSQISLQSCASDAVAVAISGTGHWRLIGSISGNPQTLLGFIFLFLRKECCFSQFEESITLS